MPMAPYSGGSFNPAALVKLVNVPLPLLIDLGHAAVHEHAVSYYQIQVAIVIQIAPQRTETGARVVGAALPRHVGELAVVVMEQPVAHGAAPAIQRDVEIGPAVVIVVDQVEGIARGHLAQSHRVGDVGEFVALVAIDTDESAAAANDEILLAIATRATNS